MRGLLLLNQKYLAKRKGQFLLLGASIALTTLLLSVALCLLRIMEQPFDITFDRLKASEILLLVDTRHDETAEISQWFSQQEEVLSVSRPSPYLMVSAPLIHQGGKIDMSIQLTERHDGHTTQDQVLILNGQQAKHPKHGEIWLPSHFEKNYALRLGDSLGLQINGELRKLKISAFVVDPHYLGAIFNPSRAWIAPGELPFMAPISALNTRMLGVKIKDKGTLDLIWKRFNENFDYSGKSLHYLLFKRAFTSFYTLLSSVLLIFSIMGLVIGLLIIKHNISSHIYSDYKQIGVLKSMGFTPGNTVVLYLMQMVCLVLIALPVGLFVSWYAVQAIVEWVVTPLGISDFAFDLKTPLILSSVLVLISILFVSFLSARSAGLVRAVDALRNTIHKKDRLGKKTANSFSSSWLPLSLLIGVRLLAGSKRNLLLNTINMAGIVFVVVFCLNISNSFDKIHSDRAAWGFDNADLLVHRNSGIVLPLKHLQLLEMLGSFDKEIEILTAYNYANLFVLSDENKAIKEIQGKVYADSIAKTGLGNIRGRHPQTVDEISLCIGTAKEFNKHPGDKFDTFIEGQKKQFTISGIYQDVGNLGQGFRLHESAIRSLNPLFDPQFYNLKLRGEVARDSFKRKLENHFGETIRTELSIEERKSMTSMIKNIKIAVLGISLFFVLVLVLITYNNQNIFIQQHKILFVKLKSQGFTSNDLRRVILWKTVLNLDLGLLIGIPLSLWLGPKIMNLLTAGIGLVRFPFIPFPSGIAVSILLLLALGALSAWLAGTSIRKANFRTISNL